MAKPDGVLEYPRQDPPKAPVEERIRHFREFERPLSEEILLQQAARCMGCGVPYCHAFGCPVKNLIPDWNDLVHRNQWRKALDLLHSTNNFPEFTGRACPAPCEPACTLAINQAPVTIKQIENAIIERGFKEGWVQPEPASHKTGRRVAVVGSGPAGLAAAQQLARRGHEVVVFEKSDRIGGLLRYGIPDFKLEKWVIDRRLEQLRAEGIVFETGVNVGSDVTVRYLESHFDATLLAIGAQVHRELDIPGRRLNGIHLAMKYLTLQNRKTAGDSIPPEQDISARDKIVFVLGGGDTGSDCVGTAIRQGAKKVYQVQYHLRPDEQRSADNPWPEWPKTIMTSSSHEEGCERLWNILVKEAVGRDGWVTKLKFVELDWRQGNNGRLKYVEKPGTEFEMDADLVLIAIGFARPEHDLFVQDWDLALDPRRHLKVDEQFMTSRRGVFSAGDSVIGASLVVTAIDQGRRAAAAIDNWLSNI
ncbi:MAG: glutamate synthase subunit beta [Candidatus Sumerlaeia bacterium]